MIVKTPYELFEKSATQFLDKPAIIFVSASGEERTYTYQVLLAGVEYLAREFSAHNTLKKGERVCFTLPNSPVLVAAYLACQKIGVVPVLLNPALPMERVNRVLQETGAKVCIGSFDSADNRGNTRNGVSLSYTLEIFFPQAAYNEIKPVSCTQTDPEDTAAILYSSGTTGEQKGVLLTEKNIFWNTYHTVELTGMTPDDRPICFLPQSHCFGINFITISALRCGATLVLHEKFDRDQVLESLVRNNVTMFFAVPAIYQMFLKQKIDPSCFASISYFFYAADSLPVESILAWEHTYEKRIETAWGLTETTPLATFNHPDNHVLGSVGTPIPGVEIKVVDENGAALSFTDVGEICVRGHCVMKGYLGKPEATEEVMRDGWFHTGDLGYVDIKGHLFIVDRIKDMINVGGKKAWPRKIEGVLTQHPMVEDVGVVGIPHDIMGEIPAAAVVLEDCADKEKTDVLKDIASFTRSKLLQHESPRGENIVFVDALPRNPSGKILRGELLKFFT